MVGAEHDPGGGVGQRHPGGLGDERHGARRPGVGLEHVEDVLGQGELHVHQAAHPDALGQLEGRLAHPVELAGAEGDRRQGARGVAGVDAGLLDVLHDPAEVHLGAVVEHVDVDLDGVVEEAVDEHRVVGARDRRALDVAATGSRRRRRSPCRARRARTTAARAPGSRSRGRSRPPRARCRRCRAWAPAGSASCSTRPNAPRSSARSMASGRGADDRHALGLERLGQPERGLPAELHDDAGDRAGEALGVHDLEHVLEGERLEVEPAARVVVGRDRLGVAVDHHRVVAGVAQGEAGVHARVVELDALADPVRAGAEDEHRRALARGDLGLLVVGAVVVGRQRGELGGAGVDRLVDRAHAEGVAHPAHDRLRHPAQRRRSGRR